MSSYQTIEVPLVGGSNPSRSKAFSQERTLNLYPEVSPTGAYSAVMYPWSGSKVFSNNIGGVARGLFVDSKGVMYKVAGSTLYQVSSNGIETTIGTIEGSGYVIMDDDGFNLLLASNTKGYIYDGTTLSEVTDSDYEAGGSVAVLNNQAIWQGLDQRFAVATAGSPSDIDGLFYATAESSGDSLLRINVFKETMYAMGTKTIESWYNSGAGSPPFDRIQNGKMEVGIISRTAVDSNDNYLYWIGDDSNLYRTEAYTPQPLMPASIQKDFKTYTLDDCRVRCITFDSQNFVMILTQNKTWVFSETTGAWFELAYKASEEIYIGYDYAYKDCKHYILSRIDSKVLELDQSLYTDVGEIIIRERITSPINGAQLGKNGGRFNIKRMEIIGESGIGNDQKENPQIMVSHSKDFGQSWSNEKWISAGRSGDNNIRMEYYAVDSFRQIQFKLRTSDPNFFNFQSIALDVRLGGHF